VGPAGAPRPGEWLLTTRASAEQDLLEELFFRDAATAPRPAGEALVCARRLPEERGAVVAPAFARQGFPVQALVPPAEAAAAVVAALAQAAPAPVAFALDVFVPDTEALNRLAKPAAILRDELIAQVATRAPEWAALRQVNGRAARGENGLYAQVCLLGEAGAAVGVVPARDALSLAPGGRLRAHVAAAAPSRAAMKLEEAFAWADRAPGPGDLCADLGAAPGGWTFVLLEHRARVLAVDPANLAKELRDNRRVQHVKASAFDFAPEEPVDWLFCDMAWRPLEVAALLAKWARRGWARLLIANIKLPMKQRAAHLLRVLDILRDGGWTSLQARQLYHDRDEVTVAGAVV
jgi:23S rRNA (cytidine2498-2'-O)-methyltransferase